MRLSLSISCALLLSFAGAPRLAAESLGGELLRQRVVDELQRDGVSLPDLKRRLVLEVHREHVRVSLVDSATHRVIYGRLIVSLPEEPEAAVAHVTLIVSGMLQADEAERARRAALAVQLARPPEGRVRFDVDGLYFVSSADVGVDANEHMVTDSAEILLRPGIYRVELHEDEDIFERTVTVTEGAIIIIRRQDLIPRSQVSSPRRERLYKDPPSPPGVTSAAVPAAPAGDWFFGVSFGKGAGYVGRAETDATGRTVACCITPEAKHLRVEVGMFALPGWAMSLALRHAYWQVDFGRVDDPATALMLRATRTPYPNTVGFSVHGELGLGFLRHDVKIAGDPGGTTDSHTSGPLIVGGGVRWGALLDNLLWLYLEVSALVALPLLPPGEAHSGGSFHVDGAVGFAWVL